MRMRGIFGLRAEQQDSAGDRVADEEAALADPFAKAVVLEEALPEVGGPVGLPPIEFPRLRLEGLDQPRVRGAAERDRPWSAATTGSERALIGRAINSRGQSRRNGSACGPAVSRSARSASASECSGS